MLGQKASWSRFNQAVRALRFFYSVTLGRPDDVEMVPCGRKPGALPDVLSQDEVVRLFAAVGCPRYRLLLQAAYACGLRVSEAVRPRVADVDSSRMVLHVRQAKGRKDRFAPLSPLLLELLREYWREHRPRDWLFPGARTGNHISVGQVRRVCRRAVVACGLTKKVSMHALRHGYATHMLEGGTGLPTLQKLPGHSQMSTTLRYTHIGQSHLQNAGSPLDNLPAPPAPAGAAECQPPAWMSASSSGRVGRSGFPGPEVSGNLSAEVTPTGGGIVWPSPSKNSGSTG